MTDLASQREMWGLAIVVWTSLIALLAVFIRLVTRGHRQ